MSSVPRHPPRIAILGGGIGGLTCASVLSHLQVHATVYESDASRDHRTLSNPEVQVLGQSPTVRTGSLDLHQETGQEALALAGLTSKFEKLARRQDDIIRILNSKGELVLGEDEMPKAGESNRPEIDRDSLRNLLLDSLKPSSVEWGKRVAKVEQQVVEEEEGEKKTITKVYFSDGSSIEADLVIGAEGAWSKTRNLLSSDKPIYTGITFVESHLFNVDENFPSIAKFAPSGGTMTLGNNLALGCQRNGRGSLRIYFHLRIPLGWKEDSGIDFKDPKKGVEGLLEKFYNKENGWENERLIEVIKACGEKTKDGLGPSELIFRPIYELPDHKWDHIKGVTLIGDSAHLITPYGGEGANWAMKDGADLAVAISKALEETSSSASESQLDAIDGAVKKFEEVMIERGMKATRKCHHLMTLAISDNAPEKIRQAMIQMGMTKKK